MTATPARRTEAIQTGLSTYSRATAFGAQPDQAAAEAISDAIRVHEAAVLRRIARATELVATSLRAQRRGHYSSDAAALRAFVSNHITPMPAITAVTDYQPAPGDRVEVTLTGPALTGDTKNVWILADEISGRWYRFAAPGSDTAPRLSVLDVASLGWPRGGGRPSQGRGRW